MKKPPKDKSASVYQQNSTATLEPAMLQTAGMALPTQTELAAELAAVKQLHKLIARLLAITDLRQLLDEILDGAIALLNADFGNIQFYDQTTGTLRVVVQRGFKQDFLDYFQNIERGTGCCGTALQQKQRVIVEDVSTSPIFSSSLDIVIGAGVHAVQSTPFLSRMGEPLGVISTHFRKAHRPSERELNIIDLYIQQAAALLEHNQDKAELILAKEVAERRAREAEEAQSILQALIEHAPAGITLTGGPPEYLIITNSKHAETLLGRTGCSLVNIPVGTNAEKYGIFKLDGTHPCAEQMPLYRATRYGEVIKNEEWIIERPNGSRIHVLCNVAPIRDYQGRIIGAINCWHDITERKQAEAALQTAQAELAHITRMITMGELTATIAHEINQPLTAIVTNGGVCLRLLSKEQPNLSGSIEAIESIISDARRLGEVLKRIRALLKKTAFELLPLDINTVIQEVLVLTASELNKYQIVVRTQLTADLPVVLGDRVQLQQVLLNLILNAKAAMSAKGWQPRELRITSKSLQADEVMVLVKDTGIGFNPEQGKCIFDSFYTTKESGLGLGLSISRTIIEAHGGTLTAISDPPQGAIFKFTLPVYKKD